MQPDHVMFVVNPVSGAGRTSRQWRHTERLLREKDYDFAVNFTRGAMHACEITRQALEQGYDHIIAVGGDGTINEVLNGFFVDEQAVNSEAALSLLPMGTGSDFARILPVSNSTEYAERLLIGCREQLCDVIKVNFVSWEGISQIRYYINVADVGVGCETCIRVNRNNKAMGGFLSFLTCFLEVILTFKSPEFKIEVDGELFYQGKSSLIAVNNGKYFGGGVKIAPLAEIDDGRMDVTLMKDAGTLDFLLALPSAYKGNHLTNPKLMLTQGRQVRVSSSANAAIEMDGETPGFVDANFDILPAGIKLLL